MTISMSPELYKKAMAIAKKELRSKSELVREALRSYILDKDKFDEARHALAQKLKEKGIHSLKDVDRMIHEGRKKTR